MVACSEKQHRRKHLLFPFMIALLLFLCIGITEVSADASISEVQATEIAKEFLSQSFQNVDDIFDKARVKANFSESQQYNDEYGDRWSVIIVNIPSEVKTELTSSSIIVDASTGDVIGFDYDTQQEEYKILYRDLQPQSPSVTWQDALANTVQWIKEKLPAKYQIDSDIKDDYTIYLESCGFCGSAIWGVKYYTTSLQDKNERIRVWCFIDADTGLSHYAAYQVIQIDSTAENARSVTDQYVEPHEQEAVPCNLRFFVDGEDMGTTVCMMSADGQLLIPVISTIRLFGAETTYMNVLNNIYFPTYFLNAYINYKGKQYRLLCNENAHSICDDGAEIAYKNTEGIFYCDGIEVWSDITYFAETIRTVWQIDCTYTKDSLTFTQFSDETI